MNNIFLNCGASLLCFRCAGFVPLEIHAKTSACGACEDQSFKALLLLRLKGFRIHEPHFFELWGLPALFSLRELRPFRNPCKTSACGACENLTFKLLLLLGLQGFRIHEPCIFELWGLPALFSLRGLRPFRNPCKNKRLWCL